MLYHSSYSCFLATLLYFFLFFLYVFLCFLFLPLFLCFLPFFLVVVSLYMTKAFLYCLSWLNLPFYPLTTFGPLWVSFLDYPLVCWLSSHHHYPVLAAPRSIPRKRIFILFSCYLWHSHMNKSWAISHTNSHNMHLVIPAHLCFFWVVCHPCKTFPPKELGLEFQNRLPPSPHR